MLLAFAKLLKATISSVMSVCTSVRLSASPSALNYSLPTARIFMKFNISVFFENLSKKIRVTLKSAKNNGTSNEERNTFSIISLSILLRMRNVSDKHFRENQNTFHVQ